MGPLPDLDQIIARLQAYIRSLLGGGGPRGRFTGGRGLAFIALAVLALWFASGVYRVQPDELGVVLRFGAYDRMTQPGLNYHLPIPIESALTPSVTRVNRTEIGYRSGEYTGKLIHLAAANKILEDRSGFARDDQPDPRHDRPAERVTEDRGGQHRGRRSSRRTPDAVCHADRHSGPQHHRQQRE